MRLQTQCTIQENYIFWDKNCNKISYDKQIYDKKFTYYIIKFFTIIYDRTCSINN